MSLSLDVTRGCPSEARLWRSEIEPPAVAVSGIAVTSWPAGSEAEIIKLQKRSWRIQK
jgi:hypothetical protein